MRLMGYARDRIAGLGEGTIADQSAVAESIHWRAAGGGAAARVSVERVWSAWAGRPCAAPTRAASSNLGRPREIEQRDVNRVVDRASRVQLQEDRMVLQMLPQDFVVDDHPGHRDPRKMLASRLEINVHLITAPCRSTIRWSARSTRRTWLVEETVFEAWPPAMPRCCRRSGGKASRWWISARTPPSWWSITATRMYLASTVRICGDHFTRDLAQACTSASKTPRL